MSPNEKIEIAVVIHHETERAILVDHGGETKVWLPRSQIEIMEDGDRTTVLIPEWLAIDKNMI